jgi:hypothetical protein
VKRPSTRHETLERDGAREEIPAGADPSTRLVDLSPYYGHLECFQAIRPLLVKTNRFTYAPSYPPNERMQNTWLSIALEGIATLAAHRTEKAWEDLAIVGTGNGLDAVGISRIVQPKTIIASDIHPIALQAARWNIANYVTEDCRVAVVQSDLFDSYPPGAAFDLIYENLPNIPDEKELFDGVRSASCFAPRARPIATTFDRHLLTLHHDFLIQARTRLRDSGWIVGVIGGRIPVQLIHELFADAGYRSTVAAFGLKIQSEGDVVLPAYAAAERETGASFLYYHPLDACLAVAREMPQPADLLAREDYARALTERLHPFEIPSTEAARLHATGAAVCHTVYVMAAQRIVET